MSKRLIAIVIGVGVVLLALCAMKLPLSPDGSYWDKRIASELPSHVEFKKGSALVLVPHGLSYEEGFQTNIVGTYQKEGHGWVLVTKDGNRILLRATLLSIRLVGPNATQEEKYPRVFVRQWK